MKNIVVGTDGSQDSLVAVRQAAELAASTGATLHVACSAHVAAELASMTMDPVLLPDDFDEQALAAAQNAVDQATGAAGALGSSLAVQGHVLRGEAASALMALCDEVDADLLVVGSTGMTGAARFLLGSVTNRCAHHAHCSVLIAR